MTTTPGWGARTAMASATVAAESRPRYVQRFTLTERLLHWVHASAFFVLLGSGLVLYLPSLSSAVARRPLIKDIHFWTGISWAGAIILVSAFGNLFFVSGLLLWYGERDTRFRLGGTVFLHDTLMYVSVVIVVGHLYLSLVHPTTRHALRGMVLGTVREDWARAHHTKWLGPVTPEREPARDHPSAR